MLVTRRCVALLVLAASASCDRTPNAASTAASTPAPEPGADAAPAGAAAAPPSQTQAAPQPVVQADAPAAAQPLHAAADAPVGVAKSKAPRAADAPRLHRVARRTDGSGGIAQMRFARTLDGKRFVLSGAAISVLGDDGTVRFDPESLRGFDDAGFDLEGVELGMIWWYAMALGGTWPEGAFLTVGIGSGSRGGDDVPRVYKRSNGVWTRMATHKPTHHWYYAEFGPYTGGSLLALERYQLRYGDVEEGPSRAEERAFAAAVAKEKPLVVVRGAPKAPLLGSGTVETFASLPTGEIFALARGQDTQDLVVWNGVAGTLQRTPAPGMDPASPHLLAVAPDQVWFYGAQSSEAREGGGLLARWDGHGWTQHATPCNGEITAMTVADDGRTYLTCSVEAQEAQGAFALLRVVDPRQATLAFEELPLATDAKEGPVAVLAGAGDTLWVITGSDPYSADSVWRTGAPVETPAVIPNTMQTLRAVLEWAPPRPLDAECAHPWVPLLPDTDRAAAEAAITALSGESFSVELREARVQGRIEHGVVMEFGGGKGVRGRVAQITKALAGKVGEPTCNERPPAQEPSNEPVP